eukprot:CAMPEP_0172764812 /NCGR_PEP_ID=MMETSP1074-20121228/177964_1 /TAXON_ID=2916 /ORGANISM="Ceratium fusus, Strain PA161109" /LENGTH=63 /DNA_ID=CAMNT_0013599641 /DNA_START=452 /DNA_END=643 /DNA_ORIENTATION=+
MTSDNANSLPAASTAIVNGIRPLLRKSFSLRTSAWTLKLQGAPAAARAWTIRMWGSQSQLINA